MTQIFISYSSKDKDFSIKLENDLKNMGYLTWLDEWKIKVGDDIPKKIEEGLSKSTYVIIVLTPESVSSGWVEKEWHAAYWSEIEKNKTIVLPVLLKSCEIPLLLKPKKYANFEKDYTIGFAQLIQAIIPTDFKEGKLLTEVSEEDRMVSSLIAKVQAKQTLLSQCIAEALPIARKYKDKEFVDFCKNELAGWDKKGKTVSPDYRTIEVICSASAQINPQYIGWGGGSSSMFSYMEQDTKYFKPVKMHVSMPIASLENRHNVDSSKAFYSWTQSMKDFNSKIKTPDAKVYCYARGNAYESVVEAIRAELTKRLLNLLPQIDE